MENALIQLTDSLRQQVDGLKRQLGTEDGKKAAIVGDNRPEVVHQRRRLRGDRLEPLPTPPHSA
jgi:hypothetical protein